MIMSYGAPTKFMNKMDRLIQIWWIIYEIIFVCWLETPKFFFQAKILSTQNFVSKGIHIYRSISTAPPRRVGGSSMIPNVCA